MVATNPYIYKTVYTRQISKSSDLCYTYVRIPYIERLVLSTLFTKVYASFAFAMLQTPFLHTVCTQSHKRTDVYTTDICMFTGPYTANHPYTVSQPASCLNVSLFAHVHYLSHLHSCGVCIFSLFIGNHLYIYI